MFSKLKITDNANVNSLLKLGEPSSDSMMPRTEVRARALTTHGNITVLSHLKVPNRSQKTSKCCKNVSDTPAIASCATFRFFPYFVIHYWTDTGQHGIYSLDRERWENQIHGFPIEHTWVATSYGLLTRRKYPAILTEQTWSIKDLLYGFRGICSFGMQQVVSRGWGSAILPVRVTNHSEEFSSSYLLTELTMWKWLVLHE